MKAEEGLKKLEESIESKKNVLEIREQYQDYFDDSNTRQIKEDIQLGKNLIIWMRDYIRLLDKNMAADA